jgi:hypothetical protein
MSTLVQNDVFWDLTLRCPGKLIYFSESLIDDRDSGASETSVNCYTSTGRYMPEDTMLDTKWCVTGTELQ